MEYFLIALLLLLSLVFKKYSIDTKLTIKELEKDKNYFRNTLWNRLYYLNKDAKSTDFRYQNLKKRIDVLISDIEDTDFSNFDGDAKYELINALKEIDFYGDSNDSNKNK